MDDELLTQEDYGQMKRVAFMAVVVSTVAVTAAVVTIPLIYNYVQNLQSAMVSEVDFCKASACSLSLGGHPR